jgi:hypothetical protein
MVGETRERMFRSIWEGTQEKERSQRRVQ